MRQKSIECLYNPNQLIEHMTIFFKRFFLTPHLLMCLITFFITSSIVAQSIEGKFFDIPNSLNRELGEMAKDDEGFIWFITNQGLCRYDGNDVKLIEYKKLQLPANSSPNHLLCYNEYIICSQATKLYVFNKVTGLSKEYELNSWVSKMYKNNKDEAVFVTQSGQIWTFSNKKGIKKGIDLAIIAEIKMPAHLLHSVVDSNNTFFLFFTDNRFAKFDGFHIQWSSTPFFEKPNGNKAEQFIRMSAVTSRYVAILFDNGDVKIYDKKSLLPVAKILGKPIAGVLALKDEIILIPSTDLQKSPINTTREFKIVDNLFKDYAKIAATTLFVEGNNKVLLSTSNGLVSFSSSINQQEDLDQQKKIVQFFKNKSIRSIYKTSTELLIGTYAGLYSCTKNSIQLLSKKNVYALLPYDKNHLIVGLEGWTGLAKYQIASKQLIPMGSARYNDNNFHVTALGKNNDQWFCGSLNSVNAIFDSSNTWGIKPLNSVDFNLGTIRQISTMRGSIFIACQEGVIKLSKGIDFNKIYPSKTKSMRVTCMVEANDGIWLGTHGDGIVKINDEGKVLQMISMNEGLLSNFIYSLVHTGNTMVVGTGSGVNVLAMSDKPIPKSFKSDLEMNGSVSQEFNHSAYFNDTSKQQVILGGVNGLAFIDYKNTANGLSDENKIELSYIKTTEANAKYKLDIFAGLKDSIKINSVNSSINLKFTCINNPENELALFRINKLSNQWQNINLKEEINIYSLPPGEYSIEVKLPYSENPREWFSKTLIVYPVFYQTILFKVFVLLVLIGIVYLIWRSRIKKLEKEFKIRTLIASDLHDDIGSTLNSISVYSAIAEQQFETNKTNTKLLLDKMGKASRDMIEKMSDIVWTIHPKNDEFEKVLDRIRFFAAEILSTKNIVFEFNLDDQINQLKLEMAVRKNIYLICKEALNNAYKYANATHVSLSIKKVNNKLLIKIEDNGKGFDTEQLEMNGNGLFNMKARAKEINAILQIESSEKFGTIILLEILL